MPVTNYYTVGGRIIGEETSGVRTNYLTDALGSVTTTVDQTGAVQNTYRYRPYGSLLAKTGTAADPAFTWVGTAGYRQTGTVDSDAYSLAALFIRDGPLDINRSERTNRRPQLVFIHQRQRRVDYRSDRPVYIAESGRSAKSQGSLFRPWGVQLFILRALGIGAKRLRRGCGRLFCSASAQVSKDRAMHFRANDNTCRRHLGGDPCDERLGDADARRSFHYELC